MAAAAERAEAAAIEGAAEGQVGSEAAREAAVEVGSGAAERRSSDQRRTSPSQRRNNWRRSIRRRHHSDTPHYGSQTCSCMSIAGICMRMWSYSRHSLGRSPRTLRRRSIYWEVGTLGVRRPRGRAALRWRVTAWARRTCCQLGAPCWLLHGNLRTAHGGRATSCIRTKMFSVLY